MTFDFITYNTNNETLSFLSFTRNFLMPLVAAGFGAFVGGWFSQRNKQNNDFKINLQYLHYANSVLLGQLNSLYSTKQQFVEPEEIQKELELMKLVALEPFPTLIPANEHLMKERLGQFKNCYKTIILADYIFPINEEKLQIISEVNQNIFTLIANCKESIIELNATIKAINAHTHLAEESIQHTNKDNYYQKWHSLWLNFQETLNYCIAQLEFLVQCFNKCGLLLTKNKKIKFKTTNIKFSDKSSYLISENYRILLNWLNISD